ncbi:MAG: hypothetical protein US50_C0054G0002 [Candidatus Nomurabacteria bacterium GW2011_GWB1_37_5]|uniref:Uncharacterized protein n=1 Tax=Candidatus Nomurabacteria bacterium GW2011_GWB1_37_5 TaxID=1618742 RepID=A0A0G0JBZ2_9BACT|nr:MAG: hypothetical protein US50_C0054G0002 [Candidatus Nomurabacteria bacterium GW2011_GWB1_37_5]
MSEKIKYTNLDLAEMFGLIGGESETYDEDTLFKTAKKVLAGISPAGAPKGFIWPQEVIVSIQAAITDKNSII